ncbi:hypothetical protein QCA50_020241 [Cerrena zonata]|uniref:Uncharacterized protein n=1 Tax=Cerrena zonata TaxID=2478898 RepID=A0AAW0FGT4_9APHY
MSMYHTIMHEKYMQQPHLSILSHLIAMSHFVLVQDDDCHLHDPTPEDRGMVITNRRRRLTPEGVLVRAGLLQRARQGEKITTAAKREVLHAIQSTINCEWYKMKLLTKWLKRKLSSSTSITDQGEDEEEEEEQEQAETDTILGSPTTTACDDVVEQCILFCDENDVYWPEPSTSHFIMEAEAAYDNVDLTLEPVYSWSTGYPPQNEPYLIFSSPPGSAY